MKRVTGKAVLAMCMMFSALAGNAQSHSDRVMFDVGALYEKGFDATLAVEHETRNHNAWEYFLNGYIKYDTDKSVGHITTESFWKSYRTWGLGIAYKPCVYRSKNSYGSLRIGGSAGSDTNEFVGWVNVGYEHDYALRHDWHLFWQVKSDLCINGKDLFRTGVTLGFKIPVGRR